MGKIAILCIIGIFIYMLQVEATMSLEINKEQFSPGEEMHISVMIENNYGVEMFVITELIYSKDYSEKAMVSELFLLQGENQTIEHAFNVSELVAQGEYIYAISLSGEKGVADSKQVAFNITGTLQLLDDIDAKVCYEPECKDASFTPLLSKSFVYLRVFEKKGAGLTGTLILPDNTEKGINFKGNLAQIPLQKPGKYVAIIQAGGENYQPKTLRAEFFAIEEDYKARDLFARDYTNYFLAAIFMIILAIVILVLYKMQRGHNAEVRKKF